MRDRQTACGAHGTLRYGASDGQSGVGAGTRVYIQRYGTLDTQSGWGHVIEPVCHTAVHRAVSQGFVPRTTVHQAIDQGWG